MIINYGHVGIYIYIYIYPSALGPKAGHDLLFLEVSRLHITTHHSRLDSSGQVISSSQRPLSHDLQHSQQTDIHSPAGLEPTFSAAEAAIDRAAVGTGLYIYIYIYMDYFE